jgi:hypothetical protein
VPLAIEIEHQAYVGLSCLADNFSQPVRIAQGKVFPTLKLRRRVRAGPGRLGRAVPIIP